MTTAQVEVRYNVTWSGDCPDCGVGITVTGYRSTEAPTMPLGAPAATPMVCPLDGTTTPVFLVGACLDPFVAERPDEDDDDPPDDDDMARYLGEGEWSDGR